jgi:hypothetical protein
MNDMKRAITLFLVFAAVGLVAGNAERENPALKPEEKEPSVVPDERPALAKLRDIQAIVGVSPAGHITEADLLHYARSGSGEFDMEFLAPLGHLEKLCIFGIPVAGGRWWWYHSRRASHALGQCLDFWPIEQFLLDRPGTHASNGNSKIAKCGTEEHPCHEHGPSGW